MSIFETKTADNFIYDEAIDPRENLSTSTPFLRKNISYVVDQQAGQGNYNSGEVIIDSQSIAASGNLIDWRNAYITVPYYVKVSMTSSVANTWVSVSGGGNGLAKYACALKNCSLLDSLKLEANGKTVVASTQGLSQLINFKLHSTTTPSSLAKNGAIIGYFPDSIGQASDSGSDSFNSGNDPNSYFATSDSVFQANIGLAERQAQWLPSQNTAFMSAANALEEGSSWDYGTQALPSDTVSADITDVHFVATIRLKDLHDYFDKHSLARGVSYRFTLRFNQAISTVTSTSSSTPFSSSPTISTVQTSGSTQPAMLCWGGASMLARLAAFTGATVVTAVVTSAIDTTANTRFSGVRLYVPSYELEPSHQERLMAQQPIHKYQFVDFMSQTTQTYAAPGASINVQVSTSVTNPRCLIVIPRWSQTATGNGGQGFYSDVSPLSTVPGTTDSLLSLTNTQIKLGNNFVLPDRMYYTFSQFQDHVASIFALNGDQTVQTSGIIDKKKFETNYRYYAYDLSRYPGAMSNLPQMVSFECKNNTQKAVELQCILLYGRDCEQNLANGSMSISA